MIQVIDTLTLGVMTWRKGTDDLYNIILIDECTGAPVTLTGGAVAVDIYSEVNKSGTKTTLAGSIVTATGGHFTIAIADTETVIQDYIVGKELYAYAIFTASGGSVSISDNPLTLKVR